MFISKKEKEELNVEIERAREGVKYNSRNIDALSKEVESLKSMFMTLIEINSEEIGGKIKDLTKTIYTGFKDLFIDDDKKVKAKSKAKAKTKSIKKVSTKKCVCKKAVK